MSVNAKIPPGPRGLPFIGNFFNMVGDPASFLLQLTRKHGDISYYRFGGVGVYLLNHPDLVKDVLVTNAGKFIN